MNILVIGTSDIAKSIIEICLKSKFLDKIYTASTDPLEEIPNIEYEDFDELSKKSRILHVDIAICTEPELIKEGIADKLKKVGVNIIAVNKKWANLESRLIAKKLASHYSINVPKILKAPISFPIVIKTDLPHRCQIATSIADLVEKREDLAGENIFLEEYLDGEIYHILTLWDGKNLLSFDKYIDLTEVQLDRLDLYKTKLNFLLSDEKADFIGFLTSKLIWAKNDWYLLEYKTIPTKKSAPENIKADFLYILNLAIYQKLNEI